MIIVLIPQWQVKVQNLSVHMRITETVIPLWECDGEHPSLEGEDDCISWCTEILVLRSQTISLVHSEKQMSLVWENKQGGFLRFER